MALEKLVMPSPEMVERRPIGYATDQTVETLQTEWELAHLRRIYREKFASGPPIRCLELGTHEGGTLRYFIEDAPAKSEFVCVTLEPRAEWVINWQSWAKEKGSTLCVHDRNSQEKHTADMVRISGPYDFIFIDADHSYPGVKRDWELYSPMCKAGGIIAMHDVVHRDGCGVHQLWREIQEKGLLTRELVADHRSLIHGIGLVYWEGIGELP